MNVCTALVDSSKQERTWNDKGGTDIESHNPIIRGRLHNHIDFLKLGRFCQIVFGKVSCQIELGLHGKFGIVAIVHVGFFHNGAQTIHNLERRDGMSPGIRQTWF